MQSRWKELTDLHASLTPAAVCSIDPRSWFNIISGTLSSSPSRDNNTQCHAYPEVCQHCHQMVALSAVTTMALLVKDKGENHSHLEEAYLQPLLTPDLLKSMVDLLQHQCQYLRCQSRKALTFLLSLTRLTASVVRVITKECVQAFLHRTSGDLCLEHLQLLCGLLSAWSGGVHRVQVSDVLLPSLPALYQHCCRFIRSIPSDLCPGTLLATDKIVASGDASIVVGSDAQTVSSSVTKRTYHGDTEDPHNKQIKTGNLQGESLSACNSILGNESVQEVRNKVSCEGTARSAQSSSVGSFSREAEEHRPKEENVHLASEREQKSPKQNCSVVHLADSTSVLDKHAPSEEQTGTLNTECDSDVCSHVHLASHHSHQTLMLHYTFLCLLQKLAKLLRSQEPEEKVRRMQVLKNTILTTLVSDHAALFSNSCSRQSSDHLLVERKFLDIMDTTLDYIWLRTSKNMDCVYKQTAVHFVLCMLATDCLWSFPCQNTLTGEGPDQTKDREDDASVSDSMYVSEHRSEDELVDGKESHDYSPVLVLLTAAVFKSCAIVFKSDVGKTEQSEEVRACARLLCSMHSHLGQIFCAGSGVEKRTGVLPTSMTWLAQVCGDQDDRWIEVLLCALDIFLCLQSLNPHCDDVKKLVNLLDPHILFLQLLEQTHYNTSLIIDWLTSPETSYLAYLTRYLRLLVADFSALVHAASLYLSDDSGCFSEYRKQVMNESAVLPQSDSDRDMLVKGGPSSSLLRGQEQSTEASRSSLKDLSPHVNSLSKLSESASQNDVVSLDKARKSSLGMVLLSCYDDDSSVDDGDESCDEGSFSDVATDSFSQCQESNGVCESKLKMVTEDQIEHSQSIGESTDSDTHCSDDEFDEAEETGTSPCTNSSISQTKTRRACHSSQLEQTYSPIEPQSVLVGRDTTQNCLDRVMHLFTEVRMKIERLDKSGLLVYNPAPLVSLMRKCEVLYDSQCSL